MFPYEHSALGICCCSSLGGSIVFLGQLHVVIFGWAATIAGGPNCIKALYLNVRSVIGSGPGSSVDIATGYGLDGPGSNPSGDDIFRPSIPVLEPTQPPAQWVPGLSRE